MLHGVCIRVYFHIADTFLLFCDFDCHASFGRGRSSASSTHGRTAAAKCATEIVLISAGNAALLFGGIRKRSKGTRLLLHVGSAIRKKAHQKS